MQKKENIKSNYTLRNDIVSQHKERISYLKKYLPFFRLQESTLTQFKEGKYAKADMAYITMALLRYFIEENHFNEKPLTYFEVTAFIGQLLQYDFDLILSGEEEKEIADYIFDKVKNDGKPFTMDYFDPEDKKVKTARMRLIDSKLVGSIVLYTITADAIEFYLETKEVKEESKISMQQLLLEKLIQSKNFRGGTEVVRRINSEVVKLRLRKQEVLSLLGFNVFEGVKALEEFQKTGMRWFEEEQRAFIKNKELMEAALSKAEAILKENGNTTEYETGLEEIHKLEKELRKAMNQHSLLLADCMELQVKSDEIIHKYKFSRLRNAFDFSKYMEKCKEYNDVSILNPFVAPMFAPQIKKSFYLGNIEELLTYPGNSEERGEEIKDAKVENFVFSDELEDERISSNYFAMLKVLMQMLKSRETFSLLEWNQELELTFFDDIFVNSDYYSFLVQLCQRKVYNLRHIMKRQDTFLDAILVRFLEQEANQKYHDINFSIHLNSCQDETKEKDEPLRNQDEQVVMNEIIHTVTRKLGEREFTTMNIRFVRIC